MTTGGPRPVGAHRPRVVHLINHLGRGGTERQLFLVLSAMARGPWEHHVLVFNRSHNLVYDDPLRALGIPVTSLPETCRGALRRTYYLGRWLRRLKPRIVHSWTVHDNAYAAVAGRLAGVPVRWGSLRGTLATPGLRALPGLYRRLMLRGVGKIVVNCRALARELEAEGLAGERVALLPNCVELTAEHEASADLGELGIGAAQPVVGTLGNLRRIKNHEMFIEAMAGVLPQRGEARAIIIGQSLDSEPEYPGELEARIEARGLARRLRMTGFRADVPAVLSRLAVLCLTSHSEGMPNAVLEAMAAGRPVVAVAVGGVPELVEDGVSGFLVAPGDARGMARAVGRILDDESLARRLGAAGLERARRIHSCPEAAATLDGLYRQALEGPGP